MIADTVGDYPGSSAEINGHGFAGMKFTARVSAQADFDAWVAKTQQSPISLDMAKYEKLREPSENNKPAFYSNPSPDLYSAIISKYNGGHEHGSEYEERGSY